MSACLLPIDWMEIRVRCALAANAVDVAQLAKDFGMSQKWVCRLAARCAWDMGIEWVSRHQVVVH